jgi:DNA-binding HxlR family transcriptional regulator
MMDDPLTLPELKGAALPVLLVLWRFGPLGRSELARRSGWGTRAVARALEELVAEGLAARPHYRQWRLTPTGRALLEPWLAAAAGGEGAEGADSAAGDLSVPRRGRAESAPDAISAGEGGAERAADDLSVPRRGRAESAPDAFSAGEESPERAEMPLSGSPEAAHMHDDEYIPDDRLDHQHDRSDHQHDSPRRRRSPAGTVHHIDNYQYDMPGEDERPAGRRPKEPPGQPPAELVRRLAGLRPPFTAPERWLATVRPERVAAWLDFLDGLPPRRRRAISNESAFLRHQVAGGGLPPLKRRPACKVCGRRVFDADGRCLVCSGLVQV